MFGHGLFVDRGAVGAYCAAAAGPEFAGSQLSILSIDGRLVWRGTYRGETVDVSALRPGLYTLQIRTADGRKVVSRFSKE